MPEIYSNQDFQLVKGAIEKYTATFGATYNFNEKSLGFEFLVLEKLFNLQEDEIIESITDTFFQQKLGNDADPDRGIDAVKIDEEKREIHLFNFKYVNADFDKIKGSEFERSEIDKILAFINDLYQKNTANFIGKKANKLLRDKVTEIWSLIDSGTTFTYKIHLVSNIFKGLTKNEEERLVDSLKIFKGEVRHDYILVADIVDRLTQRTEKINSKFRALNTNFFDKSDSGRRALIIEMSGIDLLRIVSDSSSVRENCDSTNEQILSSITNENAFSDNVRVYLKDRTNVNKNIKETALDEIERSKIFFYNNGITITCDKIDYQGSRNPIITLKDLQVVNGGQTIHALRDAFEKRQDGFEKISVLCKIFETADISFKTKIAEYTNSQNPVNDRDIRSIDSVQIKLEQDFKLLGYAYARKKFQHEEVIKNKRIDAEKLGQALMAFSLEMPAEAKNKKSIIFGEKYNLIFNDSLTAKNALNILELYQKIEILKLKNKLPKPYLLHATYYIMFFIKRLALKAGSKDYITFYDESLANIEVIINKEKSKLKDEYSDAVLFKSNRPKEYLAELDL